MDETPESQPVSPAKISKRSATKVMNWAGYFRDMRVSVVRAVSGSFVALGGSNGVEQMAPVIAHGVGISFKQAVGMAISVAFFDIMRYVNLKPEPDIKEDSQPPLDS
jgi:hypothetical protein